jgi:putative ABC transport system substrate-binding protein
LAGRILIAAGAIAAIAAFFALHGLVRNAPAERRIMYTDQEGPPFRAIYESFERKLRSLTTASDPPLKFEYFVAGEGGEQTRARLSERLRADPPYIVVTTSFRTTAMMKEIAPSTIVVFGSNGDPVAAGLVADLNRPGGNLTGFTQALPSFAKRMELLKEAVPAARRIGVLVDDASDADWNPEWAQVAGKLGVSLRFIGVQGGADAVRAAILERGRDVDAWYVPYNGASFFNTDALLDALRVARRPAIFERGRFADLGGLMAYQHTVENPGERLAEAAAQILHGVPPGEIPVMRPRRFELVVNLMTARQLGLDLPKPLVKAADRVITE